MRLIAILLTIIVAVPVRAADLRHMEDATLRSVFFIDDKEGWIAGDEGVILHTIDGGKTWERQATGVRASLRSVHFLDPFKGWAVGREELPYGMGSAGVVLYTTDGGLEWKRQLPGAVPGLNGVRFIDAKTGFFLGDGSDLYPSGLFKTTDAGRTWEPVPGPRTTTWLAGDFYDAANGILVGGSSRLGTVRNHRPTLTQFSDELSSRDVTSVQILGKKTLAVAQGGLILTSVSGGSAWDFVKTKLPTDVLANLDLHALHAVKDKVWIVGRPGSVVLFSPDAGRNWSLQKTGQPLPLHGVFFFDEARGWAVGEVGTIVATTDGGRTWSTQHQTGQRAAVLSVHARNQDAPLEMIALLGAAESYRTVGLRVTAPDPATALWTRAEDSRRHAAALRLAGAVTGESLWAFPTPHYLNVSDKKTILAHWNKQHAGAAGEELIRQLVLALRIWRPTVVLGANPESDQPLLALMGDAMNEAVRRAADAKAFPEQLGELGLRAWQVRRVVAPSALKSTATFTLRGAEPNERLQASPCDYALAAQALLAERYAPLPDERSCQVLASGFEKTAAPPRDVMDGIDLQLDDARRARRDENVPEHWRQAVELRRSTIAQAKNVDDTAKLQGLLDSAFAKLADEDAAQAAFAIAHQYAERGQWFLAQEAFLYLVDRQPADPVSAAAYRWLIRLNTSGEARRRHDLKQFTIGRPLLVDRRLVGDKVLRVGNDEKAGPEFLTARPETRDWNKGCLELMKRLAGFGPLYAFDPATQFCAQSARRQLGQLKAASDWYTRFRTHVADGPWHEAAKGELWLADRNQPAPARRAFVRFSEARPFLDGKFDDPCWQGAKPMVLANAIGDSARDHTTEVMFAHDQEFLYVALKCTHPAGRQVPPVKPRPRDANVDAFDRVSLLFDLDRDYASYYHLEIDQRGCVRDSCMGDLSWNPKWFVAVDSSETSWQIEAAIPLAELTGARITPQTAWAFNAVRIVPGQGVQSWSQPADVEPRPEGMSLLLFQAPAARPMPKAP